MAMPPMAIVLKKLYLVYKTKSCTVTGGLSSRGHVVAAVGFIQIVPLKTYQS